MTSEIDFENEMEEWNAFSTDLTMPFDGALFVDGDNSAPSQGIRPGFQLDNQPVFSTEYVLPVFKDPC